MDKTIALVCYLARAPIGRPLTLQVPASSQSEYIAIFFYALPFISRCSAGSAFVLEDAEYARSYCAYALTVYEQHGETMQECKECEKQKHVF